MKQAKTGYLHTIRGRILFSTLSLIIVISLIITAISYFVVSSYLRDSLIRTSETRIVLLCSSIDANISDITDLIYSYKISSKIRNFTLEEETNDNLIKREAHDFMIEVYTSNASLPSQLIRIVVIGKSRNDIVQVVESRYSSIYVTSDAILSLPYFDTLYSNPGKICIGIMSDPFITTNDIPMIPFVSAITHPFNACELGYIFTEMSPTVITRPLKNVPSETNSHFYVQVGDHNYKYTNQSLVPYSCNLELKKDLSDIALRKDTVIHKVYDKERKKDCIIITCPLSTEGLYLTECLDETILSKNIFKTFFFIVSIIFAAASTIGVLLFLYLSKTINVPVRRLKERMKRIENGDFERDPSTEWNHELGTIGKNINDLSENVLSLMNQRIEDERQKKDYEYKMLQSQINPHFLYNTLNSIKWMATIQNAPGIAEMTTSLSRLLKHISKGTTNLVTIEHEISLLNDYFTIQQYRYGGTISHHYNIQDKTLLSCNILNFTLQPIVENAIFHGIGPKGSAGTIDIHIYQDENTDIHIDITDDGVGMDADTVSRLFESEGPTEASFFKGIGISNVHKRLQYTFGQKYGLSAASESGNFTTISILLPFQSVHSDNKNIGGMS